MTQNTSMKDDIRSFLKKLHDDFESRVENVWQQEDVIDYSGLFLILLSVFVMCLNVTLLKYDQYPFEPVHDILKFLYFYLAQTGMLSTGVLAMAAVGLALKCGFDNVRQGVRKEEDDSKPDANPSTGWSTITKTKFETPTGSSIAYNIIMFALFLPLLFYFVGFFVHGTIMPAWNFQISTFYIFAGALEEITFSYALLSILASKLKHASVPIVSTLFMFLHLWNDNFPRLFWLFFIARFSYCLLYLVTRRLSSVMIPHMLTNFVAFSVNMCPF